MLSDRIFHWGNLLFLEYGGIINGRVLFIWNFWLMVFLIIMEYYWMTVLEWLIKWYLLDTLSQYPGWIHPGKFPSENLFREITPRRKRLGFFTSPTILYNLFHPGKITASLIDPSESLDFARWVSILPLWYYWHFLVCRNISLESRQCEVTFAPEF